MTDVGWRIAYILGGIIIFHSYFARKEIAESDQFKLAMKNARYKNSIFEMFSNYKKLLLLGILAISGFQLYWGVFMVYMPNYITLKYNTSLDTLDFYNYVMIGSFIGMIIGAICADRVHIRVVFSIGTILTSLLIYPIYINGLSNLFIFHTLCMLLSVTNSVAGVLCLLMLSRRFPIKYRYTLVSSVYAFSAFLFVGLPPFIFSYLTRESSMLYPMIVFFVGCITQLIAVQLLYKSTRKFIYFEGLAH